MILECKLKFLERLAETECFGMRLFFVHQNKTKLTILHKAVDLSFLREREYKVPDSWVLFCAG